jgi:hypothetical protein
MRVAPVVAVIFVAASSVTAVLFIFGVLPGATAPSSDDRDVIRTVTGVFSALVAPVAVYIAWRSSVTSRAALQNQTVPLLVDVPEHSLDFAHERPVVFAGKPYALAEWAGGIVTVETPEGKVSAHGVVLPLRNVGNGTARFRAGEMPLAGQTVIGTTDRHVVAKDEAVRLCFLVAGDNPRVALQQIMADPEKRLAIQVRYSDAAGGAVFMADIKARVGERSPTRPEVRSLHVTNVSSAR